MEKKEVLTPQMVAAYWGCRIAIDEEAYQTKHPLILEGLTNHRLGGVLRLHDDGIKLSFDVNIGVCKLILTPLSKISEEDARELIKYAGCLPMEAGFITEYSSIKKIKEAIIKYSESMPGPAIDKARELGYDVGHGSIPSFIAAGLAVEKTN